MNRPHMLKLLASASAVPLVPQAAFAQSFTSIKVATTPTDIGAEPFYASAQSFFKADGLEANTPGDRERGSDHGGGPRWSIDIAQSNIVSLALAHRRGLDIVAIAPAGMYSNKNPRPQS